MRVQAAIRSSVRVRVTTVAALVMLVATVVGGTLFLLRLGQGLEAGLISSAHQDVSAIAAQLARGAKPQEVVVTGGNDIVVQVVDDDGRVLASDHAATMGRPLLAAPGTRRDLAVPGQEDRYAVVARAVDHPGEGPVTLVVVGRSTEQVQEARSVSLLLLVVAVPVVVLLLAATVWMSIGRALRPVEAMRRQADTITSAHLDQRLEQPPGGDEIPRLAATLNEMLDRIDEVQRRQRQFVSDASHELRSPLTVIRQSAEVARSYPERVSIGDLADDVLAESQRLETLVSALLLLARVDDADRATVPDRQDVVDVDDLVLAEAGRLAAGRDDLALDVSRVSAGQVHGNAVLLGQVVRNLLDNAVRHARSRVEVTLLEQDGRVRLLVDDDGAGIPPEDRERVFERFVRLDEARAREEGGSGLGLAIVSKIVELAGGTVLLETAPLGGARFAVSLPAAY